MKTLCIIAVAILNCIALSESEIEQYNKVLTHINNDRIHYQTIHFDSKLQHAVSESLYTVLKDSVFPAWYGTPWDFNGISNVPGEGEIACGYFVSTTLKHVGFNLNRYKLAQQAASVIATAVCGKEQVKTFTDIDKIITYVANLKNGLFIVGLDYHVGFLVVENGKVFFVHSDYFSDKVVRENAKTSVGFNATSNYVIGEITNNEMLMKKWVNNTKIY